VDGAENQRTMRISGILTLIVCIILGCNTKKADDNISKTNKGSIKINSKDIYFEEVGNGVPLLLLSGGGLNRTVRDFDACVPTLAKHYRVIRPDSPGQGQSEQTDSLNYTLLTDIFSKLMDSLRLDSVYIMGLSDGAIVALMLAEKRADKVKRVIAVGANNGTRGFTLPEGVSLDSVQMPSVDSWAQYHEKDIAFYDSLTPKKDWKKMAANLNKMWYEKEYFPTSVYNRIKIPVLIVLGDRDDISLEHGLEMYRSIKNSQFCVLPNATHEVFAEKPELITSIAVEFLK